MLLGRKIFVPPILKHQSLDTLKNHIPSKTKKCAKEYLPIQYVKQFNPLFHYTKPK